MARLNRQTVPLRTFETKIMAELPRSTATVRSQGPLSRFGSANGLEQVPRFIEHQDRALRIRACGGSDGCLRVVRHVADEHQPALQDREPRVQAEAGSLGREEGLRTVRRDLDDGRAGPLQVGAVVEVRNEDVARSEQATGREPARDERDAVRVQVAVRRDGRDRPEQSKIVEDRGGDGIGTVQGLDRGDRVVA